jgi:hypothetical protein
MNARQLLHPKRIVVAAHTSLDEPPVEEMQVTEFDG